MHNYRVTAEVAAMMSACEAIFSHIIITSGKLTTLDREILEYYSAELQKHLQASIDLQEPTLVADTSEESEMALKAHTSFPRPSFFDHF